MAYFNTREIAHIHKSAKMYTRENIYVHIITIEIQSARLTEAYGWLCTLGFLMNTL